MELTRAMGTREWFFIPLSTAARTRKSCLPIVRITVGSSFMVGGDVGGREVNVWEEKMGG